MLVPFDGGLIVLVAVGVGYGIKKAIANRNEGKAITIVEDIKKCHLNKINAK